METRQTAVEWLVEQYANENYSVEVYEQAKEMEKEQHDLTFARGHMTGYANANGHESKDFEQYYNETYGK
jgi:hypothetical protein